MAREEQDREDLLREATALVERAELSLPALGETVVVGFRRDGCASVYFGSDPAWHFNTQGQLRRAYVKGILYKAEQGRLISLERHRTAGEVHLLRQELNKARQRGLIEQLDRSIGLLRQQLQAGEYGLVGQVPPDADVVARIQRWLQDFPQEVSIAIEPYAF